MKSRSTLTVVNHIVDFGSSEKGGDDVGATFDGGEMKRRLAASVASIDVVRSRLKRKDDGGYCTISHMSYRKEEMSIRTLCALHGEVKRRRWTRFWLGVAFSILCRGSRRRRCREAIDKSDERVGIGWLRSICEVDEPVRSICEVDEPVTQIVGSLSGAPPYARSASSSLNVRKLSSGPTAEGEINTVRARLSEVTGRIAHLELWPSRRHD